MLSDSCLDECQRLLYRAWADAFDILKAVKEEKHDPRQPDWHRFHEERLRRALLDEAKLKKLLDEINTVAPLTRGGSNA